MECVKCGGPLKVEPNTAFADCQYCGQSNKVRSARTLLAERPFTPPPARPAHLERPAPYAPAYPSAPAASGGGNRWLIAAMFGVVLLGVVPAILPVLMSTDVSRLWDELPFTSTPAAPVVPSVTLDGPEPHVLSGIAQGNELASEMALATCSGHISAEPNFRLQTIQPGLVHFNVAAGGDLVLVIQTADGDWLCDDDGGDDLLPRVVSPFGVGEHRIWVGAYSGDEHIPYTLTISEDMPGLALPGATDTNKVEPTPPASMRHRTRRGHHSMRRHARSMGAEPSSPPVPPQPSRPAPMAFAPPSPQLQAGGSLGMLTINTQPWSTIRINGRLMGRTPRHNLIVPVGRLTVEVQREGAGPWVPLHVMVRPGTPARLNHSFHSDRQTTESSMVFVD